MSIAVLNQVYDEARRLAVAGSVVARGDFRLKKLLPPLEQAGAKAPVFAKVAECARAVIDGPEESSAESLLELTSLVSAVLYTQGETGAAGPLEPIETVEFHATTAPTSARLLKPLLVALRSTGSGRYELVRDAHERGAFRDLRLVKPALDGLDDSYGEIADFLAEKVLPQYGTAILPELRAKYDPKGGRGHARRLALMHAADPAGTRDLVKQALDSGSKEVKVAAICCLAADPDHLPYLIEQTAAKAQDVRAAAYHALAQSDDPAAVNALEKALAGKDAGLAAEAIGRDAGDRLTHLLVAEVRKGWAAFQPSKDKKAVDDQARRLRMLVGALPLTAHATADALTLDLFTRREELAKVKGGDLSGADVARAAVTRMAHGPKELRTTLARAHAELDADDVCAAFDAARQALPPDEVYDLFARYVIAAVAGGKKGKGKDTDAAKGEAIIEVLSRTRAYWYAQQDDDRMPPLDPRWLDVAVRLGNLDLVHAIGRPGHPPTEAFLQRQFDEAMAKPKAHDHVQSIVMTMVHVRHPKATDAVLAAYEKTIGKANVYTYWYHHVIRDLPKSAIPRLEAVVPRLKDREADQWLAAIQELREKEE